MGDSVKDTDEYLKTIPDWQAKNLVMFRKLVHAASPHISEEIKWGVPVFMCKGKILLSMGSFKEYSKFNFNLNGAELNDRHGLFNNGLESKRSRSIDQRQGQTLDEAALADLIKQSIDKLH
jgi:hypothetical protein